MTNENPICHIRHEPTEAELWDDFLPLYRTQHEARSDELWRDFLKLFKLPFRLIGRIISKP